MQSNQKTKKIPKVKITKAKFYKMNLFVNQSDYKIFKKIFKYTLKAKTEKATKSGLITKIETLLNTMSIALQNKNKKNQNSSSKQNVNVTPPFVKGTQWAQKFKFSKNK